MTNPAKLPAILGGRPVRPQGPPPWPPDDPEVAESIHRAVRDGAWGRYIGPYGDELRQLLSTIHEIPHVWLCSSGTAAVELALRGLGVGPGDEVILAAYDFKANFTDVLALGALPVLVDIRPDDFQFDTEQIESALSPRTKAVIASHLHGGVVGLKAIRERLADRPVGVIEDACQCSGAFIGGRRAGAQGDVGVLSFGGSKLTAAGRGGAILTRNPQVIERIKRHALRGNDLSPLSELQAASLIPQWKAIDHRNRRRATNAHLLHEILDSTGGLRFLTPPASASGYYKVGFDYDPAVMDDLPRDLFCRAMMAEGVAMFPGFRGLHRTHASRRFRAAGPLPVADRADGSVGVLHHPVLLGGSSDMEQIREAFMKIRGSAGEIRDRLHNLPPLAEPGHG